MQRREVLTSIVVLAAAGTLPPAKAAIIRGEAPWAPESTQPPEPFKAGGVTFLAAAEAKTLSAIADRLIPADELGMGATEAGCVQFIDRQLAGPFGNAGTQYREGPFLEGTAQQGPQFKQTPAERYRSALAALEQYCRAQEQKAFSDLAPERQDTLLTLLEAGTLPLPGMNPASVAGFFNLVLQNVREGYFADPIYGGNKDMVGWKLVGFPGAQYDFRDVIEQRGQKLDIIPVSMVQRDT